MATQNNLIVVSNLPAIQRDLYLSRCVRRENDSPTCVDTFHVKWEDMAVSFSSDEAVSEASVEVSPEISIATFTSRMESLLDCGAKSDGAAEWTLKWADRVSRYGSVEEVRRLLCDKIASIDGSTGETVGVLKLKRRSVEAGYARVRLVPTEDSLQIVCRHQSAQGLKSVWKSVLWRLSPQYGSGHKEDGLKKLERWALEVHNYADNFPWEVCSQGVRVEVVVPRDDPWEFPKVEDNLGYGNENGSGLTALREKIAGRRTTGPYKSKNYGVENLLLYF
jgi:hypothetical protein